MGISQTKNAVVIASGFVTGIFASVVRSRIDFMENIFAYGIYVRYAKPRWQPSDNLKS